MGLKIEAFVSAPPCVKSTKLLGLLDELKKDFGEAIEVVVYRGAMGTFDTYNLTAMPAVVVEELVKIIGFCPSKESLIAALQEMGLE